jgi:hypothetical protein
MVTDCGEETEEEEKTEMTAMAIYIWVTGRPEGDTQSGPTMPKRPLAIAGMPRSWPTASGGRYRPAVGGDFEKFTEMSLAKFYKLLSNFL